MGSDTLFHTQGGCFCGSTLLIPRYLIEITEITMGIKFPPGNPKTNIFAKFIYKAFSIFYSSHTLTQNDFHHTPSIRST